MTLRERVQGWMPLIVAGGLLAAGGLVAIPLGGWDTVDFVSDDIPPQPIGQPYSGAQWTITIDDVYLTDENPDPYRDLEPGELSLVVVATLENVRAEPQYAVSSASFYPFTIPGVLEIGEYLTYDAYTTRLLRDGSSNPQLSPGVPDTVQFAFTVPASRFADGDEVRIGLVDGTAEEADIYDGTRWVDVHVAAEVVATLRLDR